MVSQETKIHKKIDKMIVGDAGEEAATMFLMKQGHNILDRNYRKKWGELDIVAKKGNIIHFVEVKSVTRGTGESEYDPEENVHPWKRKRLSRAIETYLLEKRIGDDMNWQIDLYSVYLDTNLRPIKIDALEDIIL